MSHERPSTLAGEGRKYLLTYDEQNQGVEEICEIIQYSEKPRSWFVGETVQKGYYTFVKFVYFNNVLHDTMMPIVRALLLSCVSTDGSLYMCTPVDPTFLILPYLVKSAKVRDMLCRH